MSEVIDAINAHPRVESVSDERSLGDGYWVYLHTGWISANSECGTIHEESPSACLRELRRKGNIIPDPRGPNGGTSPETMK
jgi:hypothetical protein